MLHGVTWQNALVLTIFVIMCGFIAYWGDLLGRRMGKRRLSLFGLRPRYTAIAVTTVNGMIIAVLTIALLSLVSQRVRLMLLQGVEIIAQQRQIEHQLDTTRRAFDRASSELQAQRVAAEKAREDADSARRNLSTLIVERDRLTDNLKNLKAELGRKQVALNAAEKQLAQARGDLRSARKEVTERRAEIKEQQKKIDDLEQRRAKLNEEVAGLVSELGEAVENWPKYMALRQGNIIFRYGDEIVRRVIPGSQQQADIRKAVLAVMDSTDERARSLGAKVGKNGRAIKLPPVYDEEKGQFLPESENHTVDAIVDVVRASEDGVVLRLISLSNSVEGEQILVNFVLNPNELIYKAGDEIASATIDGSQSESMVFGSLQAFFRSYVRTSAIQKGIIPSIDQDGQPSVGLYPGDQLFNDVGRIRLADRPVRVTAKALTDIRSGDTLVLKIDLGEAE